MLSDPSATSSGYAVTAAKSIYVSRLGSSVIVTGIVERERGYQVSFYDQTTLSCSSFCQTACILLRCAPFRKGWFSPVADQGSGRIRGQRILPGFPAQQSF